MNLIYESSIISATNLDVLAGGRLNAIPFSGKLTLQFQSDLADASNNFSLTLQEPGGAVPVDSQLVPGTTAVDIGILDSRQLLSFTFLATIGGHFVVSLTETGTAVCMFRAILRP